MLAQKWIRSQRKRNTGKIRYLFILIIWVPQSAPISVVSVSFFLRSRKPVATRKSLVLFRQKMEYFGENQKKPISRLRISFSPKITLSSSTIAAKIPVIWGLWSKFKPVTSRADVTSQLLQHARYWVEQHLQARSAGPQSLLDTSTIYSTSTSNPP